MKDDASTPVTSHRLPRNVKVLGGASLLNDIASEMIFPLLPGYLLKNLLGSHFFLGLVEGVADSVSSLLKLWSGGMSDRAGRRKNFVVFGYSLAALTRPLIGVITLPWQLLVLRIADRIGKGVRTSPRDALIADSTHPTIRGRAFGFHRGMDHLGAAIGPLLAAGFLWLWPGQLQTLFLAALVPGVFVILLVAFGLHEPPVSDRPVQRREPLRLTLKPFGANFKLYLVALVVFTLGNSTDAFLLLRAAELGVPEVALPLLWCAFHIIKSSSNMVLGRGVDRFGPRPFLFMGWFMYAGVYLLFGLATTAWQAWVLFGVYAVYYGLAEPAEKTLVVNLVGSEHKGLAYGWYHFAIGIATLPASVIFGTLYQVYGAGVAFGWGAGLALVAALLLIGVRKR